MTLTRRLTHTLLAATALLWPALAAAQTERPSPEQIEQMLEPLRPTVEHGSSNNPTGIGEPTVEVLSIYGFDRRTNEYTVVGFDTMGTYYVTAAGTREPDGLMRMRGETLEIEAGTKETRRYDMTLRVVDADTYVTEIIFRFPDRDPLTVVSITHRRQR